MTIVPLPTALPAVHSNALAQSGATNRAAQGAEGGSTAARHLAHHNDFDAALSAATKAAPADDEADPTSEGTARGARDRATSRRGPRTAGHPLTDRQNRSPLARRAYDPPPAGAPDPATLVIPGALIGHGTVPHVPGSAGADGLPDEVPTVAMVGFGVIIETDGAAVDAPPAGTTDSTAAAGPVPAGFGSERGVSTLPDVVTVLPADGRTAGANIAGGPAAGAGAVPADAAPGLTAPGTVAPAAGAGAVGPVATGPAGTGPDGAALTGVAAGQAVQAGQPGSTSAAGKPGRADGVHRVKPGSANDTAADTVAGLPTTVPTDLAGAVIPAAFLDPAAAAAIAGQAGPGAAGDLAAGGLPAGAIAPASAAPAALAGPDNTAAPAAPPAPQQQVPTPAAQLAQHVAPLRHGPDGVQRIAVELRPAELGTVGIIVEIRNGNVHLNFTGGSEATREALRDAMPDLHRELQQAGFATSKFDVDDQRGNPRNPSGNGPGGDQTGRAGGDAANNRDANDGNTDNRGDGRDGTRRGRTDADGRPDGRATRPDRTGYGRDENGGRIGALDLQV